MTSSQVSTEMGDRSQVSD